MAKRLGLVLAALPLLALAACDSGKDSAPVAAAKPQGSSLTLAMTAIPDIKTVSAEITSRDQAEARARIGSQSIRLPGHLDVPPGPTTLELYFDDGVSLFCPFTAAEGLAVRYVVERGRGAISVDDGLAIPCTDASAERR